MVELFAYSGDPDQMPRSAASDLGLHSLPITLLGVSRLPWVKPETDNCLGCLNICLCWGFKAQSTQWGHVERGQFT